MSVELGHHEGRCCFERILTYDLTGPALREIASMVHEADVDDHFHTPEAADSMRSYADWDGNGSPRGPKPV